MDRFPDATGEDLARCDGICIICREEMTPSGAPPARPPSRCRCRSCHPLAPAWPRRRGSPPPSPPARPTPPTRATRPPCRRCRQQQAAVLRPRVPPALPALVAGAPAELPHLQGLCLQAPRARGAARGRAGQGCAGGAAAGGRAGCRRAAGPGGRGGGSGSGGCSAAGSRGRRCQARPARRGAGRGRARAAAAAAAAGRSRGSRSRSGCGGHGHARRRLRVATAAVVPNDPHGRLPGQHAIHAVRRAADGGGRGDGDAHAGAHVPRLCRCGPSHAAGRDARGAGARLAAAGLPPQRAAGHPGG
jgi:hypothetical protein